MKKTLLLLFSGMISIISFGQNTTGPASVGQGTYMGKTIPLRDFPTQEDANFGVDELSIIPNDYSGIDMSNANVTRSEETLQSEFGTIVNNTIDQNFDGSSSAESGFLPPDPSGAVGPNHYVHAVNSLVKIFDKEGNLLAGPTDLGVFIGNGTNRGDPIILYDQLADRWFVSQFGTATNSLVLAVSETNDPLGAYFMYEYVFDAFPDYPHYAVWPDGYYLTVNEGGGGGGASPREVYVLERDAILAGEADPQIAGFVMEGQFSNPTTIHSGEPANLLGTSFPADTPGFFTYLQDDSWDASIEFDQLMVWEVAMDWDDIDNSTITSPQRIPLDSFDTLFEAFGVGDIEQPGTGQKLAGQGGIISYMANYRSFEDHNSWLITFNVDVDGNDTSGIRWVELRNTADNTEWTLYQEGTYAPADGNSRFMSSSAIDAAGNIALAFSIAGPELPVGASYTGRFDGDELGLMTIAENVIVEGIGVQSNSNRFGDYAQMTMDPDNFTFWYTTQYFEQNNFWTTRITSFNIVGGFVNDVGVAAIEAPEDGPLTDTESVTVSIRNYGTDAQSNIPLELTLDGAVVGTGTFTGTIEPNEVATFTFDQTVDLSTEGQVYAIGASTLLATDEFATNDELVKDVKHLFMNDVGATAISAPVSAEGLSGSETITATIQNFGTVAQSDIPVTYDLDGTLVSETFAGPLAAGESADYSFTTPGDFFDFDTYTLTVATALAGDQDTSNDSVTEEITNTICQPQSDCAGFGDGVTQLQLADQDIIVNCGTGGYSDDTDIVFEFDLDDNPFEGTLQMGWPESVFAIWVDFNDNNIFEPEELIANDLVGEADTDFNFSVNFVAVAADVTLGMHRMRVRGEDEDQAGDVLDPCGDLAFGRTNDYMANFTGTLSAEDRILDQSELTVTSLDNNTFDINLITSYDDRVYIGVYNTLGQQLKYKGVAKNAQGYGLKLDMSAMSSGVYIIRMGGVQSNVYKSAKIIVK